MIPSRMDEKNIGFRRRHLGQLFAEGLIMDLERKEQDGINGDRRNGRLIRERYATALHEGDEKESYQARSDR